MLAEAGAPSQPAGFGAAASTAATDFSQYYDPSAYWQASSYASTASAAAWPSYDQATGQTDYAAYYQQQAVAHAQNALAQQQMQSATQHAYSADNDEMALIGKSASDHEEYSWQ